MPSNKINPIAEKLMHLVGSGKTTKEKICVAAELKYHTLQNIFTRPTISYMTLKSLKYCGIITEKDEIEYHRWVDINVRPEKQKARKKRRIGKKQVNLSPEVEEAINNILLEDDNDEETGSDTDQIENEAKGS